MSLTLHNTKIALFRKLHEDDGGTKPFVILNAWDAISARQMELAGAPAIATTSLGMSAVFGYQDGEVLPFSLFLCLVERMASAISIPLSVDFEAGYGKSCEEICCNVEKLILAGVCGINIEDADPHHHCSLYEPDFLAEVILGIKQLAIRLGVPGFFVNARTDTYWQKELFCSEEERVRNTLNRLLLYKEAGADCLFIPGLVDLSVISRIRLELNLPINVQNGPWKLEESYASGVRRISTGSALFRLTIQRTDETSNAVLRTGERNSKLSLPVPFLSYAEVNSLWKDIA